MAVKKLALLSGAIAIVGLSSIAVLNVASAANQTNKEDTLVSKISQKFNLNKSDVQKVFDEEHLAREAEMKANYESKLTQAVKDGKITEDQKTKLLAKEAELHTYMQSLNDKTREERKTAMDVKRTELEKWAKDNGISNDYLPGPMGGKGKMMGGGRGMHGENQ